MSIGKLCYFLVLATTLVAGRSGFRISVRERNFSRLENLQADCGAHIYLPVPWVPVFLPRVKLLGREVNPSSLSNAKVKNEWSYTSNAPYAFKAWLGKTLSFSRVGKWGTLSLICVRVNKLEPLHITTSS
jgi:hypothetical protein